MRTLVFGLTSQVGDALWPGLAAQGAGIVAVSRHPLPEHPAIDWRVGMLQAMPALPGDIGTILSLGPLDLFAGLGTFALALDGDVTAAEAARDAVLALKGA